MTKLTLVQINGEDYGDELFRIEAKSYFDHATGQYDFAVPAWEEMGLAEFVGEFETREAAAAALASVSPDLLAEYGYRTA